MKNIFIVLFLSVTFFLLIYRISKVEHKIDQQTIILCASIAPIRKEEYKDTKWKDFDFYQSCIDNIECTSPVVPCERKSK